MNSEHNENVLEAIVNDARAAWLASCPKAN